MPKYEQKHIKLINIKLKVTKYKNQCISQIKPYISKSGGKSTCTNYFKLNFPSLLASLF